jgi:hypothetical protein
LAFVYQTEAEGGAEAEDRGDEERQEEWAEHYGNCGAEVMDTSLKG